MIMMVSRGLSQNTLSTFAGNGTHIDCSWKNSTDRKRLNYYSCTRALDVFFQQPHISWPISASHGRGKQMRCSWPMKCLLKGPVSNCTNIKRRELGIASRFSSRISRWRDPHLDSKVWWRFLSRVPGVRCHSIAQNSGLPKLNFPHLDLPTKRCQLFCL